MERRLKIGIVSITTALSIGKGYPKALAESLPKGTEILNQWDDNERASIMYTLYNKEFNIVGDGKSLPKVLIDVTEVKKPQIITAANYPH